MKKCFRIFTEFVFLICFFCTGALAGPMYDCMKKFNVDDNTGLINGLKEIFPKNIELTQEYVTKKAPNIYGLMAANTWVYCRDNIMAIAEDTSGPSIVFNRDGKEIEIQFSIEKMFEYLNLRTGVMVWNKLIPPADGVIKLDDIKELYWSDECSDHTIWDNLDDDAAVNIAGQNSFSTFGGSKNEFFLDFEEGNNRRAFPGLVIMDKTGSTTEKLVSFFNIIAGQNAAKKFAESLKGSECSGQGLAVYLVALDVKKDTTGKDGWLIGASVGGGAMAFLGVGAALATSTAVAATGSTVLVTTTLGVASAASWVPVAGWIAAGVLVTAAGVISMIPGEIEDLKQVKILAGPFII